MTDQTLDLRFLQELVSRTDATPNGYICGTNICADLGEDRETAHDVVIRLTRRGLVTENPGPRKNSWKQGEFNIRPTDEAYRLVNRGLHG